MKVNNYINAFNALKLATSTPPIEDRDFAGIVKSFEFTYETGWKALKDFLSNEGHEASSARECFKVAYQLNFLNDEEQWLEIIDDRNRTVHTYNKQFSEEICDRISSKHIPAFEQLKDLLLSVK